MSKLHRLMLNRMFFYLRNIQNDESVMDYYLCNTYHVALAFFSTQPESE